MCIDVVSHSKIKVEENRKKVVFLNKERESYEVGRIDGCLVSEGVRADYFVSNKEKTVLIELKGINISHACEQLFAAIEHNNVKKNIKENVGFIVVCSRFPKASTTVQRAKTKAMSKYRAKFSVFCTRVELNISDC